MKTSSDHFLKWPFLPLIVYFVCYPYDVLSLRFGHLINKLTQNQRLSKTYTWKVKIPVIKYYINMVLGRAI